MAALLLRHRGDVRHWPKASWHCAFVIAKAAFHSLKTKSISDPIRIEPADFLESSIDIRASCGLVLAYNVHRGSPPTRIPVLATAREPLDLLIPEFAQRVVEIKPST